VIRDRRVLAVVPARGGSKGIHLKNLRRVNGKTLIQHVGEVVAKVLGISRAVVSTDHPYIVRAAFAAGLDVPFMRPERLSGDCVSDFEVLIHALETMEDIDKRLFDVVVMLQPTSPLRRPEHVSATIDMLIDGGWDSVWTVSPTDSKMHPMKQLTVSDGRLDYYGPGGAGIIARQQLEPVYHRNGIAYAVTRECLLEQQSTMGRRAGALVMDGEYPSIDTEWDISLVEFVSRGRDK